MLRKVIQLGDETLVVSLPSAWARQHKLRKGDELEAEEAGPKLILYPKSEAKQGKTAIDVSGCKPMIKRVLGALYKAGYDEFEVTFATAEELASVKEVLAEFIGFEIVAEGKTSALVKNVSHIIPDEFDNIQRKMAFVIATMADEGMAAASLADSARLKFIASMDADVNRYADFCRRILNTVGHKVVKRVPPAYYITEQLEKIGDSYRDICLCLAECNIRPKAEFKAVYARVTDLLKNFLKVYSNFDLQGMTNFAKAHYELLPELEKLLKQSEKKELPAIMLLKTAESDIFDLNGAVMAEKL